MASSPIVISKRQNWLGRIMTQLSRDLGAWLYVGLVFALASVLAFIYLAQASYAAKQVVQMVQLEQELDGVHEENSVLRLQIAEYEEVSHIKSQARAMGFGEAKHVEYVEVVLDEAGPTVQGNMTQSSAISAENGGQPSALGVGNGVATWHGLRLGSVIAQQFQGWITSGTAGQKAEQARWGGTE